MYLCGYAIECQLKASICAARQVEVLALGESKKLGHDLTRVLEETKLLRKLVGIKDLWIAFSKIATRWSTEMRYLGTGSNERECKRFLRDAEDLISWLRTQSKL